MGSYKKALFNRKKVHAVEVIPHFNFEIAHFKSISEMGISVAFLIPSFFVSGIPAIDPSFLRSSHFSQALLALALCLAFTWRLNKRKTKREKTTRYKILWGWGYVLRDPITDPKGLGNSCSWSQRLIENFVYKIVAELAGARRGPGRRGGGRARGAGEGHGR